MEFCEKTTYHAEERKQGGVLWKEGITSGLFI